MREPEARANRERGVHESASVNEGMAIDTVSQRRVATKVACLAVWGAALQRTKPMAEQVPLFLSAPASHCRGNRAVVVIVHGHPRHYPAMLGGAMYRHDGLVFAVGDIHELTAFLKYLLHLL